MPFIFADFIFYPFAVINGSCEYSYMLSPVSPPSKLLKLRTTNIYIYNCQHVTIPGPTTHLSGFPSPLLLLHLKKKTILEWS